MSIVQCDELPRSVPTTYVMTVCVHGWDHSGYVMLGSKGSVCESSLIASKACIGSVVDNYKVEKDCLDRIQSIHRRDH